MKIQLQIDLSAEILAACILTYPVYSLSVIIGTALVIQTTFLNASVAGREFFFPTTFLSMAQNVNLLTE